MRFNNRVVLVSVSLLAAVALLGWTGCKTDEIAGPARVAPPGPATSLENPPGINLPNINVANVNEVDLVEEMILHRAMYARLLRVLATYYSEQGYDEKATWARTELNDLRRVKPYMYIKDAITPTATLRPTESIAEADRLYEEGRALMVKGGRHDLGVFNQETMKQALAKFMELVQTYPKSDKIAEAAYYIAEIHKEYMEEKDNSIAVQWYQRAIDWKPSIQLPARFQMATVYDFRLHEREKALEMYHEVLEKETFNKSNVRFASRRIEELTPEANRRSPGEPVGNLRPEPTGSPAPAAPKAAAEASPPAPSKAP